MILQMLQYDIDTSIDTSKLNIYMYILYLYSNGNPHWYVKHIVHWGRFLNILGLHGHFVTPFFWSSEFSPKRDFEDS